LKLLNESESSASESPEAERKAEDQNSGTKQARNQSYACQVRTEVTNQIKANADYLITTTTASSGFEACCGFSIITAPPISLASVRCALSATNGLESFASTFNTL
jgi:hypothetical protein